MAMLLSRALNGRVGIRHRMLCQHLRRLSTSDWDESTAREKRSDLRDELHPHHYVVYADGACRGNPGVAGCGAVLYSPAGQPVATALKFLGNPRTNNLAEYAALQLALELGHKWHVRHLTVRMDSQLVVSQMNGDFRVRAHGLVPLFQRCKRMSRGFELIRFEHVPRTLNKVADRLASRAIDEQLVPKKTEEPSTEMGDMSEGEIRWEELRSKSTES